MKNELNPKVKISLWEENLTTKEKKVSLEAISHKFIQWIPISGKSKEWFEYYGSRASVWEFLSRSMGCSVDVEPIDTYQLIADFSKEKFWDAVNKLSIQKESR